MLLAAFIGSLLYMVVAASSPEGAGLAREEALLSTPLPADADLPHVVVQIPSFNEGGGASGAASRRRPALDWPRDKLHIQVLDDSTDETAEHARAVAAELRAKGFDVVALQRTDRSGLQGRGAARGDAADAARFLRDLRRRLHPAGRLPAHLHAAVLRRTEDWAFVQARFDFLNPHENALTEMQMVTLDAHLGIEQATRCWAGHPLPFNGTCGIWQRAAIEAGGGWKGDTVTEDLDLTYRGWVKGWRALFLTSVGGAGRTAGRHQDLAAPAAALAGRLPPCLDAHVPGDPEEPGHHAVGQARGAAASLHGAQPAGASGRRRVGHAGGRCWRRRWCRCCSTLFAITVAWVLVCATTFLRAGHNFIRGGEIPPLEFGVVLMRFVGGQVATRRPLVRRPLQEDVQQAQAGRVRPHAQARDLSQHALAQQRMVCAAARRRC